MNVLELKYNVMQNKIDKLINFLEFCYIDGKNIEDNNINSKNIVASNIDNYVESNNTDSNNINFNKEEKKNALLKTVQTTKNKYIQSFNRIINSQNINKSLKYKELEKLVMQIINNVELEIAKTMTKDKETIEQKVSQGYEELNKIKDIDQRLQKIEELKNTYSYFNSRLGKEVLEEYYMQAKFITYFKKTLYDYYNQQKYFNAFSQIQNQKELEKLSKYLEIRVLYKILDNYDNNDKKSKDEKKNMKLIKKMIEKQRKDSRSIKK